MGAYYASGVLDTLARFGDEEMKSFADTLTFMDVNFGKGTGIIAGKKLIQNIMSHLPVREFDSLDIPLGVVATDLTNLQEVHITEGALFPALRASFAIPGFLTPEEHGDIKLVDGALLNSVPVNLARKMGADIVIAVDLDTATSDEDLNTMRGTFNRSIETMMRRIRLMNRHTDPADIMIEPVVTGQHSIWDMHRTDIPTRAGYDATQAALPEIRKALSRPITRTGDKVVVSAKLPGLPSLPSMPSLPSIQMPDLSGLQRRLPDVAEWRTKLKKIAFRK